MAHLRQQMADLGLTQRQLAARLGVTEATVSRVLNAGGSVGLDLVLAIHRKLHLSANQLLDVDPPRKYFE